MLSRNHGSLGALLALGLLAGSALLAGCGAGKKNPADDPAKAAAITQSQNQDEIERSSRPRRGF